MCINVSLIPSLSIFFISTINLVFAIGLEYIAIHSDGQTDFGDWGNVEMCSSHGPAIGFTLLVEAPGGDDTGLNGIKLRCGDSSTVTSELGNWGDWKNEKKCPPGSFLKGFKMKSEKYQGSGDDTAANDLIMFCKNPNTGAETILDNAGGTEWGEWGLKIMCPEDALQHDSYIVGIQTQVEKCSILNANGCGDDTSLNNVAFLCSRKSFRSMRWINSDGKTYWGYWGPISSCSENPTTSFRLKVEGSGNDDVDDDTALNGIELKCNQGGVISSSVARWGDQKVEKVCPRGSYLHGFEFKSQSWELALKETKGDDTAANDLIMYCKNPITGQETRLDNAGGRKWGTWGAKIVCPSGSLITSIQTQVCDSDSSCRENQDDNALNQVNFVCSSQMFSPQTNSKKFRCHETGRYLAMNSDGQILTMTRDDSNYYQDWIVESAVDSDYFYLRNAITGQYIDCDGTKVYPNPLYKNDYQKWKYVNQELQHKQSGKVLESDSNGNVYPKTSIASNSQKFIQENLNYLVDTKTTRFVNYDNGLYLTSDNSFNIFLSKEDNNNYFQKWIMQSDGNGWYFVRNAGNGRYIDGDSVGNIYLNPLYSNDYQRWQYNGRIQSKATGRVLHSTGDTGVITYNPVGDDFQKWIQFDPNIRKFYNAQTKYYLSVNSAGQVVVLDGNNRDSYQEWIMEAAGQEWFFIRNVKAGLYLDSDGNGNIYTNPLYKNDYQRWKFDGKLICKATNRVIDSDAARKISTNPDYSNNFQKWVLVNVNNVKFQNYETKFYLSSNNANGINTQNNDYTSIYQEWIIESPAPNLYYLKNAGNGLYLNSNAQLSTLIPNDDQVWKIDGKITNYATNRVLDSGFERSVYTNPSYEHNNYQKWTKIVLRSSQLERRISSNISYYFSSDSSNGILSSDVNDLGNYYQRWIFQPFEDFYYLKNMGNGNYLDGNGDGAIYLLGLAGSENQKWYYTDGILRNRGFNRVLDAGPSSVFTLVRHSVAFQKWLPGDLNIRRLYSAETGYYLSSNKNNVIFTQEGNVDNIYQKWVFELSNDGWFCVRNFGNGLYLDSNYVGDVYLLPGYGNDFQKWKFDVTQDYTSVKSKATGRVIDSNYNKNVYTSVQVGNNYQNWFFM